MVGDLAREEVEVPGEDHTAVGEGGVGDAKESEQGEEEEVGGGAAEMLVDELGKESTPEHGGDDETVAEGDDDLHFGERLARKGHELVEGGGGDPVGVGEFDAEKAEEGGEEGEGDGRGMFCGDGVEGLEDDVERDEDEDGGKGGAGDEFDEEGDLAEHAAESDEDTGEEGVSGAGAHVFVGGLSDVGGGLGNAAAHAGEEGGESFGEEDAAGVVIVSGGAGAFVDVDAADDGEESEGDGDGEIFEGGLKALEEVVGGERVGEVVAPGGGRDVRSADEAVRGEKVVKRGADKDGSEDAGHSERKADTRNERQEDDAQGHDAHERHSEDVDERLDADESESDTGKRSQQSGFGDDALDPVAEE